MKYVLVVIDCFRPTGLSSGKYFLDLKLFKGLVIVYDGEGLFTSFKIVSPDFDGGDDCETFLVMYFVVDFSRIHFTRREGNRVEDSVVVL